MPRPDTRGRIIAAALDCIARQGVERLSLVEVAEVAGLGRQTVYRHFASRDGLLSAALVSRIDEIVVRLAPVSRGCADLEEALVVLNIASVQAVREDALLARMIESGDRRLERFMSAGDSPLAGQTMELWGSHLGRARAAGRMRAGLTESDVASWIRSVQLVLLMRDDLGLEGQELLLRQFVIPAICAPPEQY